MPKILVDAGVPLVSKLKLISWNVNSLRAREPLVQKLIKKENPDILCVQELKIDDGEYIDNFFTSYDYQTISQTQKSYNGVSISIKNQKVYKILGSQISNQNNTLAVPNDFEILVSSFKG